MPEVRTALESTLGPIYRIEREVRSVGRCRMFVGHEVPRGVDLVVKVLPSELSMAIDPTTFAREVLLLADRLTHPRLMQPREAGRAGRYIYYSRRFLPGTTLASRLMRLGPLPLHQVVHILSDVMTGLAHAHALGVVHGDVRPENVLIGNNGAVLGDAGIVAAVAASLAQGAPVLAATEALCASDYLAPERRTRPGAEAADDVFAAGALAYATLTGEPPGRRHPGRLEDRRSVPPALRDFVTRCLAEHPGERWRDGADALAALKTIGGA